MREVSPMGGLLTQDERLAARRRDGAAGSSRSRTPLPRPSTAPRPSVLVIRRDVMAIPAADAAELALNPWRLPVGVTVPGELPWLAHRASLGPPSAGTRHCSLLPAGASAEGPERDRGTLAGAAWMLTWCRGRLPIVSVTLALTILGCSRRVRGHGCVAWCNHQSFGIMTVDRVARDVPGHHEHD